MGARGWAGVVSVALLGSACAALGDGQRPLVMATAYPLAYFAAEVTGDATQVASLIPAGVEPHEWEPSPRDLVRLQEARLFVYNGAGLEPWAERTLASLGDKAPPAVEASQGMDLLPAPEHGNDAGAAHGGVADPHVWLDPVLAQRMVERLTEGLARVDAANADRYRANAARLQERLAALDERYRAGLRSCRLRTFITAHAAFGYLAKRYGLQQLAVAGVSPETPPSAGRMAELVLAARQTQAKYVFFEALTSPALAQTLAREAGLQTLVLDPIEGFTAEDAAAGKDYFTAMEENLENLRRALECA